MIRYRSTIFAAGIRSWKTTLVGALTQIGPILTELSGLLDDDPTTGSLQALGSSIGILLAFLFARDGDKSSEDVGVRGASGSTG